MISVAQDTGGEEAAGRYFDVANATFTQIVDENHLISRLYNMNNVPMGVWINEEGVIVRPNEVAYSSAVDVELGGKRLFAAGDRYVAALRDWVAKGAESEYALTREEIAGRMAPADSRQSQAEVLFQMGNHFHRQGAEATANSYWEKAQALRPDSWNYHRQDWSFTPGEAGANWMRKFQGLGDDEDYYPALKLDE